MAVRFSGTTSSSLDIREEPPVAETDRCVAEQPAAALLGVSAALLRKWRRVGGGPPYLRIGRLVRYRLPDLRKFIESCAVDPVVGGKQ